MRSQAQIPGPEQETRTVRRSNTFYPQARVILQVVFENFGEPKAPKAFPVIPRSVTIYSNSYKEADTWSLEFDAADFPFSPNMIRAGAVEIYLFNTPGIGQLPETITAGTDGKLGIEPSIAGLFDNSGLDMDSDGRTFTLDGTDYTALFTAKQWDPRSSGQNGRIPSGRPLDKIMRELMSEVPSASAMRLEISPPGASMPTVGSTESKTNKKGRSPQDNSNYWDVMYDLAVRHGFVLYVSGLKLMMVEIEGHQQLALKNPRKMAWGRNLTSLRLSRRIGKERVPTIRMSSYDDKKRKIITGEYPKGKAQVAQTRVNGLGAKVDEIKNITVHGVRSEKQLEQMAKQVYYSLSRAEQKVEIMTDDLVDLEGRDLIELKAGDAMLIGFDAFNSDSVILEGMSEEQRVQRLKNMGYEPSVAAAISASIDDTNLFKVPFRVKEATVEWNHESGMSFSIELQNFVNIKKEVVA